jgi:hypothetical protein
LCLAYVLLVSHNRKFKPLAWEGINNIPPEERNGCDARLKTELTLAAVSAQPKNCLAALCAGNELKKRLRCAPTDRPKSRFLASG